MQGLKYYILSSQAHH